MHSFLIIGQNTDKKNAETDKLVKKLKAKPLELELKKIANVRDLIKFTKLALSGPTAIIIKDIQDATIEAQNAFLKELEEPQNNLYYLLTTKSAETLLPTIVSRCQVIRVKDKIIISKENKAEALKFIKASIDEKLKLISNIKGRDDAKDFVSGLILGGHSAFIKAPDLANFLEKAQETLAALEANGNVQLQLTRFVISL